HVVGILPPGPGIANEFPEAGELQGTIGGFGVADGMLHEGVGDKKKKPGDPRAKKSGHGRPPVAARAEALFTVKKKAEEGGFKEKRKDAFHGQGLADHTSGI